MQNLFSFFAYLWRVFINLIMLVIVLGTLLEARGRFEVTVIAILGLTYVTIRSMGIGHAMAYMQLARGLDAELTRIRELLGEDRKYHREDMDELQKMSKGKVRRLYIDAVFYAVAFFICLYWLGTASDYRRF
jgi:hypothetical protein